MYDFTIIGSGAGGSAAALELLKNGYSVEIYEEGIEYKNQANTMMQGLMNLWRNNGINLFNGNPILNYGEGKCVGGSTVINGGVIDNTRYNTLENWDKILNENFFFNNDFSNICKEIKDILVPKNQINDPMLRSASSDILINAAKKKNLLSKHTNLAFKNLNVHHNSPFGCKEGNKNSLDKNYHKFINDLGGVIISRSKVTKLFKQGNIVDQILTENPNSKEKKIIKIKNLILSGGPTQSPKLILKNNLTSSVNNLNFHMNIKVLAFYGHEINSYRSSLLTHHIREFENEGVLFMASNYIKPLIASYLNFQSSDNIKELLNEYKNGTVFNCQIQPDFSVAKITKSKLYNDININWKLDDRDFFKIKKYLKTLIELSFLSGAKKILLPIENASEIFYEIDKALKRIDNLNKKDIEITSVHSMSSCSLNNKEKNFIDKFGKIKNFKNVNVMDASLLPTNTGQHPQLTIMAMVTKLIRKNIENKKFSV